MEILLILLFFDNFFLHPFCVHTTKMFKLQKVRKDIVNVIHMNQGI